MGVCVAQLIEEAVRAVPESARGLIQFHPRHNSSFAGMLRPAFSLALLCLVHLPSITAFGRLRDMFARRLEGAEPCEDTDADCERLTLAGECTANPVWMAMHCAKSCDTCRGVKLPAASTLASSTWAECSDSHKSCERWARDGECESNPGFMKASCRASCAECESSKCHDKDSGCPKWAAKGECRTNSDFMLQARA